MPMTESKLWSSLFGRDRSLIMKLFRRGTNHISLIILHTTVSNGIL